MPNPTPNPPPGSREHLKRISKLGVAARTGKPPPPYAGSFLDFLDAVGKSGASRAAWRAFWKVVDGQPLDPAEREVFQRHTGRTTPPTTPARECWCIAGRRSGKSEQPVTRATWRAINRDWTTVLSRVRKLGADGYGEQQGKKVLKRFHDLRHTFAQLMTDAGVPQAVIMELGTWKTTAAFSRHRITRDEVKREAVEQMERHMAAERERATKVVAIREAV